MAKQAAKPAFVTRTRAARATLPARASEAAPAKTLSRTIAPVTAPAASVKSRPAPAVRPLAKGPALTVKATVSAAKLVAGPSRRDAVTSTRATASRPLAKPAVKAPAKALVSRPVRASSPNVTAAGKLARGRGGRAALPATRLVRIKALDPCTRCGPNTSVEQLYRVDEQVAGTATVHLVFFDRHGWYCVHGASCVAVRDVHAELKAQRSGRAR